MRLGFTDHVEGLRYCETGDILQRIERQVILADNLGADYFWFSEHHNHVHYGHLPTPLLYALHLAGKTRNIHLGTAIICLNLHHPMDVAEQISVADLLMNGRLSAGFGSGSSPEEFGIFGRERTEDVERHQIFEDALKMILDAFTGQIHNAYDRHSTVSHKLLPESRADIFPRLWQAVNSHASAQIAGKLDLNMMFSHLRTPTQNLEYKQKYLANGGSRSIAINRPILVAETDDQAWIDVEPALRTLWRRFQTEGKIAASISEPKDIRELATHPINFVVGSPISVVNQLLELNDAIGYDVVNAEVNWLGLTEIQIARSISLLCKDVMPMVNSALSVSV